MIVSICPFSLWKTSRTLCVHSSAQAVLLGYCCTGCHAWAASFSCEDQLYLSRRHAWPSPSCTWLRWRNTWGSEWRKRDGTVRTVKNKIRYCCCQRSRLCALPCPMSPKTKCLLYNNLAWLVNGPLSQYWDTLIKQQVKDRASSTHHQTSQTQKPLKILDTPSGTWAMFSCLNPNPHVPSAQTVVKSPDFCYSRNKIIES